MTEIGAFEAEATLGSLLDRVEAGEEILITREGRPVARLVSGTGAVDLAEAAAALKRIRLRSAQVTSKYVWPEMKQDRDFGRP